MENFQGLLNCLSLCTANIPPTASGLANPCTYKVYQLRELNRKVVNFIDILTSECDSASTIKVSNMAIQVAHKVTCWMSPKKGMELFYGITVAFLAFLLAFSGIGYWTECGLLSGWGGWG